jgi:hypothetical protein
MNISFTLQSENEMVVALVGDFARGIGCRVEVVPASSGRAIRTELPDDGDTLLELLDYVALSATKAGVDSAEPLCRVTYRRSGAAAKVTLGLRVVEFDLQGADSPGV